MKISVFALILLGCFASQALSEHTKWYELEGYTFEKYIAEFHKGYASTEEYNLRKQIFEQRLKSIRAHNADSSKTWKRGINHLSDLKEEEFKVMLGYDKNLGFNQLKHIKRAPSPLIDDNEALIARLPTHVDWREKSVVTAVKDQGQCGSCWTFGTAETIESHYALAKGELQALSEQQILDCVANPNNCGGSGGCGGGTAELAYAKLIQMGGITSEWQYPYISYYGKNFPVCDANKTAVSATISDFVVLAENEYYPILSAVATVGPLVVNVDASVWHDYESGVFDGCNQTNPDINHIVQLVGYGTSKEGDYWLVRNSWSPKWGEKGYIRLARSPEGRCGQDNTPGDGTGCTGGPASVTVCGTCGIFFDANYPIISKSKN